MSEQERFSVAQFSCGKSGGAPEEYEDAYASRSSDGRLRAAIADGATEASFSQLWARLVVESFVRRRLAGPEFFQRLEGPRRLWRRRAWQKPLLWYADEKARLGAYTAFLGLTLDAQNHRFQAVAIGDSCLFHLDRPSPEMRLLCAFPLAHSQEFGSTPFLLATRPMGETQHGRVVEGAVRPEDVFLLATDALATWMLKRREDGWPVWKRLATELSGQAEFLEVVEEARAEGARNDDMTLLRIVIHS